MKSRFWVLQRFPSFSDSFERVKKMKKTEMYLITETSEFMMSFLFITREGNAVVVDGGRPEDMPSLFELIGNRPIKAWILTHPHLDHISGFNDIVANDDTAKFPEKVYYAFPELSFMEAHEGEEAHTLRDFVAIEPKIRDRAVVVSEGDEFSVDELRFTILQACNKENQIAGFSVGNENSLVFRVEGPKKSVMFLGDIGPESGDRLYQNHWQDLKSDIVQVAHHGHSGPGAEVYMAIDAKEALWCAPDWLWEEEPVAFGPRLYGTMTQRMWLERLGVKKNYVTMNGTQRIII